MRLPGTAHTDQPWRIHALADDFRLEDVWAIRTPGAGPGDFPEMLAAFDAAFEPARQPWPLRFLFAVRFKLGAWFGWDKAGTGPAAHGSLRDRLPDDLRALAPEPAPAGELSTLYVLDRECAREIANGTAHAIMHLGWVPAASGDHELRMAVLVRPKGRLGRLYMAGIAPFRHLIVLPTLTRLWERAWRERGLVGEAAPGGGPHVKPGPQLPSVEQVPSVEPAPSAEPVERAVGERAVPAHARALTSLPSYDYVDWFALRTDAAGETAGEATGRTSAEDWARAMFGDEPSRTERFIWRGLLGLRLAGGRSPRTVAGWRIAGRGEDWVRLEAASGSLTGQLIVRAAEGRVSLTTFLRYDRTPGRLVWTPLSAVHRRLGPGLLRETAAKVGARQRAAAAAGAAERA
ncbi:DUF2867 domain-containing protein [Streptomyces sp. NPDC050418]|uniref:DUF2867 domain-containing protein n=1 Tax=Streptomyces sp. NPDC050418 TaxID=3365612 RepID=UPI00379628A3